MFQLSRRRRRNFSELRALSELNEISRWQRIYIRDVFGLKIEPLAFPAQI